MADLKTHLRELSPILAFLDDNINPDLISPKEFNSLIKNNFSHIKDLPENIIGLETFSSSDREILHRGIILGKYIKSKFNIKSKPEVVWSGNMTHSKIPIDLIINNIKLSLKEESFILENMGLYKYISLITGNETLRGGSHIFNDFANDEYNAWFNYSWNSLLDSKSSWKLESVNKVSVITFKDNSILMQYNNVSKELPLIKDIGIKKYTELTSNVIREKVFSKWLKSNLEKDSKYLELKRECSIKAGENLIAYLKKNINPVNDNLKRLLRIYSETYYYAKTTKKGVSFFKIPNTKEFSDIISIEDISYSVPTSQLNIITRLENKLTGHKLTLRNEVRFSHGQFNGTPEAKMYYDKNSDLATIYIPI